MSIEKIRRAVACVALALVAASCSEEWKVTRIANEGTLCIRSVEADAADRPIRVVVGFARCLSSSCNMPLATSCSITRNGNMLRVESAGGFKTATEGVPCTGDCRFLTAECTSNPLPDGDYTVLYGDEAASVTLPTARSTLFASNGPSRDFCGHYHGEPDGGAAN